MRTATNPLSFVILAAIATFSSSASADTMYKCTDQNGKVSFSDLPCAGKSKTSTLNVIAPQRKESAPYQASLQLEEQETETEIDRLRRLDAGFQKRLAERERAEANERLRAARDRTNKLEAKEHERQEQARQDAKDAEAARQGSFERVRREQARR